MALVVQVMMNWLTEIPDNFGYKDSIINQNRYRKSICIPTLIFEFHHDSSIQFNIREIKNRCRHLNCVLTLWLLIDKICMIILIIVLLTRIKLYLIDMNIVFAVSNHWPTLVTNVKRNVLQSSNILIILTLVGTCSLRVS